MIGLIILGILFYLFIICPLVGYFWLHKLEMSRYKTHTIKEIIKIHGISGLWLNGGYQMPNITAGFYITLLLGIVMTSVILIINGI